MAGPPAAFSGSNCAGTVLDGNYPGYTDSRFISPSMILPAITGDEEIQFRFRQWFSYSSYDAGYIQVSVYDPVTVTWSDWDDGYVSNAIQNTSPAWSLGSVDLTAYTGKKIKVAFYHTANRDSYGHASESTGWYIDDVAMILKVPEFSGNFEAGFGDWYADNGLWEVGVPNYGPTSPSSGLQCAGTVLEGIYGAYTDSRLISPSMWLPSATSEEEIHFRFMQWFSLSSYDYGYVQISVQDLVTGEWGIWTTLGNTMQNTGPAWSLKSVDLTDYAGEHVRMAIYHTANRDSYGHASESSGWYIDDVQLVKETPALAGTFEFGWNGWYADNGLWEVGEPTYGPPSAHNGVRCAGTVLDNIYSGYTDSRLISPSMWLPAATGDEEIHFQFMQWFSLSSYDYGYVQISVQDQTSGEWGDWLSLGNYMDNTSNAWSRKSVDLTLYAGERVRIALYHTASRDSYGHPSESSGWYIDDVKLISKIPTLSSDFENGLGDWYADNGLWEMGVPIYGPSSAHGGLNCVGTVLNGTYGGYTDSRLISPTVQLPIVTGLEELNLYFWHWFSFSSYDMGYVQISVFDPATQVWGDWYILEGPIDNTSGSVWTLMCVPLTQYAGKKVRIAFYHTATRDSYGHPSESSGWYIDDVQFPGVIGDLTSDRAVFMKGDTIQIETTITNNMEETKEVYFATNLRMPDGSLYPPSGYLYGPVLISLSPFGSETGHLSFTIPTHFPCGNYTYNGYVTNPSEGIYNVCSFDFRISRIGVDDGISIGP